MEVPDLVLVTKADLGAPARRAARELRGALSLGAGQGPGVALVSARTGDGLDAALGLIAACRAATGNLSGRRSAQAAAWASAQLVESFGSIGFAALAPIAVNPDAPFEWALALHRRARAAVHKGLKDS
jgi:LAO/AO transport system kinase